MSEITTRLQELIDAQRIESFQPGANIPDADVLGVTIAHWADWSGEQIVEAFLGALEDANFHALRAEIAALAAKEFER